MKQWYEKLFENYANNYDRESFTYGTQGEVDFIEAEAGSDKGKTILDVGCGTGRHSVELAKRGYTVTGFDLSEDQLNKAREKAEKAGVNVSFFKKDARNFRFEEQFDLIIMLCEGAFPLMETDEMNYDILKNIYPALADGGKFIFTTLNALFPLCNSTESFLNSNVPADLETRYENAVFDLMTFREYSTITVKKDDGRTESLRCNDRYYAPTEIKWLLKTAGFSNISIHGCKLGSFNRNFPLTAKDYEMLVLCEKHVK